jgi:hypothetical protein
MGRPATPYLGMSINPGPSKSDSRSPPSPVRNAHRLEGRGLPDEPQSPPFDERRDHLSPEIRSDPPLLMHGVWARPPSFPGSGLSDTPCLATLPVDDAIRRTRDRGAFLIG